MFQYSHCAKNKVVILAKYLVTTKFINTVLEKIHAVGADALSKPY